MNMPELDQTFKCSDAGRRICIDASSL